MLSVKVLSRNARTLLARTISSRNKTLWTADRIVKSPHKDVVIPNITIPEQVWQNLDKWADKPALVCGVTNRSYTYNQVYKYSRNFAANLRTKLGIRDGDIVCIMMSNSPEYGIATLGILQSGAEVTTVNPVYTIHEVQKQMQLSNPKLLIGTPLTINVIKDALKLAKKEIPIIMVDYKKESLPPGTISFEEFAMDNKADHTVLKEVRKKADDIAFLPYSSGTTGQPKGVELTHRNIVANLLQLSVDGVKYYDDTTNASQDSVLGVLPFFHCYGFTVVMLHNLAVGQKIVTVPRFQPDTLLNAMKEHRINILLGAPPLVLFLASHKDVKREHLANLKLFTSGGAPLPVHDVYKVFEKSPSTTKFKQVYGLTEMSPLATVMTPGSTDYTTSGPGLSNTDMRIVNSDMQSLGPNEVGELLIRGPQVMKGYRNNPEATKAALIEDGWFITGDSAKIDEQGVLTIADRIKELIKVKAFQVPPAELECVLKEHPGVLDAAVIGIPDDKQGEVPKAFVVLKEGHSVKADDVTSFVSERVAPYKRIKEVQFLEQIPKNPSGKILRRVLKEKYC